MSHAHTTKEYSLRKTDDRPLKYAPGCKSQLTGVEAVTTFRRGVQVLEREQMSIPTLLPHACMQHMHGEITSRSVPTGPKTPRTTRIQGEEQWTGLATLLKKSKVTGMI